MASLDKARGHPCLEPRKATAKQCRQSWAVGANDSFLYSYVPFHLVPGKLWRLWTDKWIIRWLLYVLWSKPVCDLKSYCAILWYHEIDVCKKWLILASLLLSGCSWRNKTNQGLFLTSVLFRYPPLMFNFCKEGLLILYPRVLMKRSFAKAICTLYPSF